MSAVDVRALSVRPPWSHYLRLGAKRVENRTWTTRWRGQLVIHAGQKLDPAGFTVGAQLGVPVEPDEVNRGEYIAVAELVDAHMAGQGCGHACDEWAEPDCWHWVLAGVRPLVTIDGPGRLGLWVPPTGVIEQVGGGDPS